MMENVNNNIPTHDECENQLAAIMQNEQVENLIQLAKKELKKEKAFKRGTQIAAICSGAATTALAVYAIKCMHDSKHNGCSSYTDTSFNY